ncbi:uncharacterized protein EI90DRAFT_3060255 [Cantharellus anzutake]|uniref:uncharacterized protein n=1 Tax=Cantharellus anzutake TaxID=1750568 RepID=UPI0019054D40|nr:uncharacterized protein EI90DRAFT_3060255 [Cantharellus anzutake]KAF8330318.1 hypothetical protein EI90DRAFT_3060255 [Cantharellus anzutake]
MFLAAVRPHTMKFTLLALAIFVMITSLTLLVIALNPVFQFVSLNSDVLLQQKPTLPASSESLSVSPQPDHVVLQHTALSSPQPYTNATLGIAGRIFVISLPRRDDRRVKMKALAEFMRLKFTFVNATDASDAAVTVIMERVRWERSLHALRIHWGLSPKLPSNLTGLERSDYIHWPPDAQPCHLKVDSDCSETDELGLDGSDLWTLDPLQDKRSSQVTNPLPDPPSPDFRLPLPCTPLPLSLPSLMQSHDGAFGNLIRGTADALSLGKEGGDSVAVVLEDDVDMEFDLKARLALVWPSLPARWDIVFLGHCWSPGEGTRTALRSVTILNYSDYTNHKEATSYTFALHPSISPKCTHAYAVSKSGANRIIRHLRTTATHFPHFHHSGANHRGIETQHQGPFCHDVPCGGTPFAYSRALDQALVRLIQGHRLRAFSIVPSIIIQTKDVPSDIMRGNGSSWKDELVNSALERMYHENFSTNRTLD